MSDPSPDAAAPTTPAPSRRLRALGLTLLAGVALVAVVLGMQVEDWSRDLTTNRAATAEGAADERLRPVRTPRPQPEVVAAVVSAAADLPRWSRAPAAPDDPPGVLRFVRTTALLRFKDDVVVRVEDRGEERVIHAESRSRVGKGDLGQNPRNLRALLEALRARL